MSRPCLTNDRRARLYGADFLGLPAPLLLLDERRGKGEAGLGRICLFLCQGAAFLEIIGRAVPLKVWQL